MLAVPPALDQARAAKLLEVLGGVGDGQPGAAEARGVGLLPGPACRRRSRW
jgi:hypothetical protein